MSLFKNQNFITQIAKQNGILDIDPHIGALIQASVQNQTRRLLQESHKVMTMSHRQQLQVSDIETAMNILGIKNISLTPAEEKFEKLESGYLRNDRNFTQCEQFIKQELKQINHTFEKPQIRGRWILLRGVVPKIHENYHIKNFKEILELQENQFKERNKKFNIIRDQPLNLITVEEQQFFRSITNQLEQGIVPGLYSANPQRLIQMFIWYLKSTDITDTMILFLFQLLKNAQVQSAIQPHLYSILITLMAYEGIYAYKVGVEISKIIKNWSDKYPSLVDIASLNDGGCYSIKIKKLAFQKQLGLRLDIDKSSLEKDLKNRVSMAKQFAYLINKNGDKMEEDLITLEENLEYMIL